MKITKFTGLNNVQPAESLVPDKYGATALREAVNVDIDLAGELSRRDAYTSVSALSHADVWEGAGFVLAVVAGDLVRRVSGTETTIAAGVGTSRMWYVNLPDGRTAWNNGTSTGIVGLSTSTGWGISAPDLTSAVAVGAAGGNLYAGDYLWAASYVRSDGLESAPGYGAKITLVDGDQVQFSALPILSGHTIRLYLAHHNGAVLRRAGETASDSQATFNFTGKLETLIRECMTEQTDPAPTGKLLALWRGRALVADGRVLWASRPLDYEHFDMDSDHKQFAADITMVQPVQSGIFVGTESQLVFLRGEKFDQLVFERASTIPVVLGSGATVPGNYLMRGDSDAGAGDCMVCIAGGSLVAGYQDGSTAALTERSYRATVTEVSSAFRVRNGVPQYLALPR